MLKLLSKYKHKKVINSFKNDLQMTAVLRTLSSSLPMGGTGRPRFLQITPAQKNPELFRDFSQLQSTGVCFSCTKASAMAQERSGHELICFFSHDSTLK